ncbi:hypothetical protein HYW75_06340, partial [Candidatus Pacearchaeota archaeon]|nr:hypothetical protein [Candidatus Pacearchaeota archaeon]
YLIGVDESFLEHIEPIYLNQYFTIIKEKNAKEKIIISKGSRKFGERNLEYKEVDKKLLGDTAIIIHQNKVYLFILEEPLHLIVIKSKKVAETYCKQFDFLWKITKK